MVVLSNGCVTLGREILRRRDLSGQILDEPHQILLLSGIFCLNGSVCFDQGRHIEL